MSQLSLKNGFGVLVKLVWSVNLAEYQPSSFLHFQRPRRKVYENKEGNSERVRYISPSRPLK